MTQEEQKEYKEQEKLEGQEKQGEQNRQKATQFETAKIGHRNHADQINQTKQAGGRIICVGTTSCRTIESATDDNGVIHPGEGDTSIFIYPGYRFKMLDCLITNFHLPESTLLMLVSALAGKEHIMAAYEEAVKERYRFFSFGDAMFIS